MPRKTWADIDIPAHWFDYAKVYAEICALHLPLNPVVVEVGCWLGKSTCYLGEIVKELNGTLYAVDKCVGPYDDEYMDSVVKRHAGNIAGGLYGNILACQLQDVIVPIVGTSAQAVKLFADNSIDFCWIDAAHDYNSVVDNLNEWFPKVKPGAVFGGHDYNYEDWPEVTRAVDEWVASRGPDTCTPLIRDFNFIQHPKCWTLIKV